MLSRSSILTMLFVRRSSNIETGSVPGGRSVRIGVRDSLVLAKGPFDRADGVHVHARVHEVEAENLFVEVISAVEASFALFCGL